MKTLTEQLNEVLKANVSQQLGEQLQARFAELEQKEKKLEDLETKYQAALEGKALFEKELASRKAAEATLETANTKLKTAEEKERNLEVSTLKIQLEESNKRSEICRDLVSLVFKNPTFKTLEQHWGTMPVERQYSGGGGSYIEQHATNKSVEKTIVQE